MRRRTELGKPIPLPDVRTRFETEIVDWADRIIAATPAEQQQLLWLYRADRRKIVVVPPGVNSRLFYPRSTSEAKSALGLPSDTELLLFVGRLEPLKGVDSILHALVTIRGTAPEAFRKLRLVVIGGHPTDQESLRLKHLCERHGLNSVMQFLGAKSHDLLPIYYSAATTVVMPSDYESFGLVALEAMASGTPVIASEVGGLAFLVRHEETGYLVPVRDPGALASRILELVKHPEKRQDMGRKAHELAQRYSWSEIGRRLLSVLEEVTRQSPIPRFNPHKR